MTTSSVKMIFVAALVCGASAARARRAGARGLGPEGAAAGGQGAAGAAAAATAAVRRDEEAYAAAAGNSILEPASQAWAHASRLAAAEASSTQLPLVALARSKSHEARKARSNIKSSASSPSTPCRKRKEANNNALLRFR